MTRAFATFLVASTAAMIGCGAPETSVSDDGGDAPSVSPADDEGDAPTAAPAVVAPGRVALQAPRVGYSLETRTSGEGFESLSRMSVVGETKEAWCVELEGSAYEGFVMGLLVDKEDQRVTRAFLGKPGKVGQQLNITEALPLGPPVTGTPGEVSIAIGSFACMKQVMGESTSWIGAEGELKGVLLKHDDPSGGPFEMKDMPVTSEVEISGCTMKVTRFAYTNGSEQWRTTHEVVVALNAGGFKTVMPGVEVEVTAVGTDRKPLLTWN